LNPRPLALLGDEGVVSLGHGRGPGRREGIQGVVRAGSGASVCRKYLVATGESIWLLRVCGETWASSTRPGLCDGPGRVGPLRGPPPPAPGPFRGLAGAGPLPDQTAEMMGPGQQALCGM